jgi:hypothetical protein
MILLLDQRADELELTRNFEVGMTVRAASIDSAVGVGRMQESRRVQPLTILWIADLIVTVCFQNCAT